MSVAYQYYVITLIVYFAVNAMACWALNLQFGVGGVMNFAFIIFQAIGAYIAGVMTMGKPLGGRTGRTSLVGTRHGRCR